MSAFDARTLDVGSGPNIPWWKICPSKGSLGSWGSAKRAYFWAALRPAPHVPRAQSSTEHQEPTEAELQFVRRWVLLLLVRPRDGRWLRQAKSAPALHSRRTATQSVRNLQMPKRRELALPIAFPPRGATVERQNLTWLPQTKLRSTRYLVWRYGHSSTCRHVSAERLRTGTYTCVYFGIGRCIDLVRR